MSTEIVTRLEVIDTTRMNELENKYEFMRTRIQSYDQVLEEFKNLQSHLSESNQRQTEIREEIEKIIKEQGFYSKSLSRFIGTINDSWQACIKDIGTHKVTFSHHEEYVVGALKELGDVISRVDAKIPFAAEGKAELKDLSEFKILIADQLNDVRAHLKSRIQELEDRKDEILALADTMSQHEEKLNEHGKAVQGITIWLNKFEEKMIARFTQHAEVVGVNNKEFQERLKKAIEEVKQDILGTPSSNAAVEARILNRLEMATLDGSNAVTVARNNEEKLKLLEKKLEALSSQLKKYEITK